MSLENEYYNEKQLLENAQERLAKMEALDVSKMTSEQLESRNRVIKGAKKDIKECEEILEEITDELTDFIKRGGEVSEKTKEAIGYFEPITIDFKIVSNMNENVYVEGYATINDEEAEDVDWYYWNGSGYTSQRVLWHDGVQITGATMEQENELAQFESDLMDDDEWITDVILQSNDDENGTYTRENLTLIINEGAKMECEIKEPAEYRGDYIVELIPKFNGQPIDDFAEYMIEFGEEFDPWDSDDSSSSVENGHIYFEMSKDYWDEDFREKLMDDVNEEARRIFARILTWRLGIYAKYGDVMEQALDNDYDEEWLQKLAFVTDDNLDAFLRSEGLIDEELE